MEILKKINRLIFGYDIFVSYSRMDSLDYAYKLSNYFISKGYNCYIDQLSSTMPGKNLPQKIITAIRKTTAFVIVGSEGAQNSEPIGLEIDNFLSSGVNRPLIPINIDNVIFKSAWYPKIEGLALIEESKDNFLNKLPSENVLNRVTNSLIFTKKSDKLKRLTYAVLLVVTLLTIFAFLQAKNASQAIADARTANQQNTDTKLRLQRTIADAKKTRDSIIGSANDYLGRLQKKIDNAQGLLEIAKTKEMEMNNKIEVRRSIANAMLEYGNKNPNVAFRYAIDAYRKAVSPEDQNLSKVLLTGFMNDNAPKFLDNKMMPFNYDTYGADRAPNMINMSIFEVSKKKKQLIVWTREPNLDNESGFFMYQNSPSGKWTRKLHNIGLLDLKNNTGQYLSYWGSVDLYGYYFFYSKKENKYYFLTDENKFDSIKGEQLRLLTFDENLNEVSSSELKGKIQDMKIDDRSRLPEVTYIDSHEFYNGGIIINLVTIHDEDDSTSVSVSQVYLDSTGVFETQKVKLDNSPSPRRVVFSDQFANYLRGDSLYEKDALTGEERILFDLGAMSSEDYKSSKYQDRYYLARSQSEKVIMIFDYEKKMIRLFATNEEGFSIYMGSVSFRTYIANVYLDELRHQLVFESYSDYYRVDINKLKTLAKINEDQQTVSLRDIDNTLGGSEIKYYVESNKDRKILLKTSNLSVITDPRQIFTADPMNYHLSDLKTLLCVNTRSVNGEVSVNDLSNIMLPDSILDDPGFYKEKFKEIEAFATFDKYQKGNTDIYYDNKEKKLVIKHGSKKKIVLDIQGNVSSAGIIGNSTMVYYFTDNHELSGYFLNIVDIPSGARSSFAIDQFLRGFDRFKITDRYIYISNYEYDEKNNKIIRIINPAISNKDFDEVYKSSIY